MDKMKRYLWLFLALTLLLAACSPASNPTLEAAPVTEAVAQSVTDTVVPATPTLPLPTETFTPIPTETPTQIPYVDSLKAKVTSDKLVCRYGPGANYLYLIAFNNATPLRLIGRATGNDWVLVENEPQRCWVNAEFVEIQGDLNTLYPMYPDGYKIPVSPYYGPTTVLSAVREGTTVKITWAEVLVSP